MSPKQMFILPNGMIEVVNETTDSAYNSEGLGKKYALRRV